MKKFLAAAIPGVFILIVGIFILAFLLIKWVWAWTIPDLFPGAVEQGLIAGTISWFSAFKLAIFTAILAGFSGSFNRSKKES
jgi:hypothetical protein